MLRPTSTLIASANAIANGQLVATSAATVQGEVRAESTSNMSCSSSQPDSKWLDGKDFVHTEHHPEQVGPHYVGSYVGGGPLTGDQLRHRPQTAVMPAQLWAAWVLSRSLCG